MDGLSSSSDPNTCGSGYTRPTRMSLSDDGVILASTKPKKRAGRTKFKETRHPIYRGVRMRNVNKWVCEVREPNKKSRIWLGTYPSAEMAARAHDVAALALRGNMACLNFADSVWRLPVPATNVAKDIREAAAKAAEAFRPKDLDVYDGDNIRDINDDKSSDGNDDKNSDGTTDGEDTIVSVEMEVEVEGMNSYMDEELMFSMPRLISDMAEGMLLSPPRWSSDDVETPQGDMSLWNFSI